MGAGASVSQDDDHHMIKSAGGTPCRSPVISEKKTTFFSSNRTLLDDENGLLYDALVEEMETKAKIEKQIAGIAGRSRPS